MASLSSTYSAIWPACQASAYGVTGDSPPLPIVSPVTVPGRAHAVCRCVRAAPPHHDSFPAGALDLAGPCISLKAAGPAFAMSFLWQPAIWSQAPPHAASLLLLGRVNDSLRA